MANLTYNPVAAKEQDEERLEREAEARMAQQQETYDRLTGGLFAGDPEEQQQALADHIDKLAPALVRLHRAYFNGHRLTDVAAEVQSVALTVDCAFLQYSDDTADFFLEEDR